MSNTLQLSLLIKAAVEGLGNVQALIGEIDRLGGSTEDAEQQASALVTEFDRLSEQAGIVDQFRRLSLEATQAQAAFDRAQQHVDELTEAMTQARAPTQAQAGALESARAATDDADRAYQRASQDLHELRTSLEQSGIAAKDAGTAQASLVTALGGVIGKTDQLDAELRQVTRQFDEVADSGSRIAVVEREAGKAGTALQDLGKRGERVGEGVSEGAREAARALDRLEQDATAALRESGAGVDTLNTAFRALQQTENEAAAASNRLAASIDTAEQQASELAAEFQRIGQNTAPAARLQQLTQEATAAQQALGQTRGEVDRLNRGFTQSGSAVESQTQALEAAQEAAQAANSAYQQITRELQELRAAMAAAGLSSTELAAAQDRIRAELAGVTAGIGQLEARLQASANAARQTTEAVDSMTARMARAGAEGSAALARIGRGADDMARHTQTAAQTAETSVRQAATGFDAMGGALKSAAAQALAFFGALEGAKQLISLGDLWQNLNARIKLTADTQQEFNTAQKELFGIAQDVRSDLEAIDTLYTKTEQSVRDFGGAQQDALDLTRVIAQSFKVSGAAAGEAAGGTQQLAQALQSGVLRGDEFNSVMENAPRLAKALADGLGEPVTKLRAMAEAGELSAERVIKALLSQKDVIEREYGQLPNTVEGALTQAKNSLLKYVGELNESAGVTQKIAGGIQALSGHLSELASVTASVAAVYGGSLLKNVTQATAAKLEGVRASRAQAAAAAEATAATRVELQQHVASAEAHVAEMRARIANTQALIAHIRAQGGQIANDATLLRLQQQLLTQQNALTAATVRQAEAEVALQAATARTAAAASLTQKAMAGIGNAVNVATAAFIGWEIGQFLNKFETVRIAGAHLAETFAKLGTVWKVATGELTAAQGKAELETIRKEFDDIRITVTDAYRESEEQGKKFAQTQGEVKSKLDETAPAADKLAAALDKTGKSAGDGAGKIDELAKSFDLLIPENVDRLALAVGRLSGASEGSAREVRENLAKAFAELTGPQLAAELDAIRARLESAGPAATQLGTALDVGVRESLKRLGLDADQALGGMSRKVSEGIAAIESLKGQLDASGVTGARAGTVIKQAFTNLIDSAKTTAELQAINEEVTRLGQRGDLTRQQLQSAYGQIAEAQRKLGVTTQELRAAQDQARVSADELAAAVRAGTATQDQYARAAGDAREALRLQAAQAHDTAAAMSKLAADITAR
jgi:tape measure domain-containing protein